VAGALGHVKAVTAEPIIATTVRRSMNLAACHSSGPPICLRSKIYGDHALMAIVERTDNVQDYFVRHAARFDGLYGGDNMATRIFDQFFRKPMYERYRLTIEALGDAKGKRYLDLGCGSGRYAISLASLGADVVGLDFSRTMLNLAKNYAREEGVSSKVHFIETDMNRWMDETNERFDAAFAMGVFDYLEDPVSTLRRMLTVADRAQISIPAPEFPRAQLRRLRYKRQNCPVYFYTREDTEALVAEAAGKIIRIESLGRRSGFWVELVKG
jgi:SAM-dependent methyltransferase